MALNGNISAIRTLAAWCVSAFQGEVWDVMGCLSHSVAISSRNQPRADLWKPWTSRCWTMAPAMSRAPVACRAGECFGLCQWSF